jgi:hypothetical protein
MKRTRRVAGYRPTMPWSGRAGRRWRAAFLASVGALSLGAAIVVAFVHAASLRPLPPTGPMLPNLQKVASEATEVRISSPTGNFTVKKSQIGWVMPEKGNYVVSSERVQALLKGLEGLSGERAMTSDPAKFDRLSLGDPTKGGTGTRIDITGVRGALSGAVIVGARGEKLFARRPNENQTWAVTGTLPVLSTPGAWLDVRSLKVAEGNIARIENVPPEGRAYVLERIAPDQPFGFGRPLNWLPVRAGASGAPAPADASIFALARFEAVDVKPAPAVVSPRVGLQRVRMFDGLIVDISFHVEDNAIWTKFNALADRAEAQPLADAYNASARAWSYAIPRETFDRWLAGLDLVGQTTP